MREMKLEWILGIQILFLSGVTLAFDSANMDSVSAHKYLLIIASFISHILASQCFELTCITICNAVKSMKLPRIKLKNKYKNVLYVLVLTTALTRYYSKLLLNEELLMLWVACAAVRYSESKSRRVTITYGEALACSFAEGFLFQVIPPGGKWVSSYRRLLASEYKS